MSGIEHWELYSNYTHYDDIRSERDISELRQEVIRQRIYIDQLTDERNKAQANYTLLYHQAKYDWDSLMYKLVERLRSGEQSVGEFLANWDRAREARLKSYG